MDVQKDGFALLMVAAVSSRRKSTKLDFVQTKKDIVPKESGCPDSFRLFQRHRETILWQVRHELCRP